MSRPNVNLHQSAPTPYAGSTLLRCYQCGRTGINGFRIIPPTAPGAQVFDEWSGPFIVCASRQACERRWPKNGVSNAA